jgi:hypothetical protein
MYMYNIYIYIYVYIYISFRHTLFSLFDLGCILDHESWYSVRKSSGSLTERERERERVRESIEPSILGEKERGPSNRKLLLCNRREQADAVREE